MEWEKLQEIASGTFGTVYKVQNVATQEIAALKIIHTNFRNAKDKKRIKRGFESASKVNHTNCVRMLNWIERDSEVGFLMEFVEGSPISAVETQGFASKNIASLQETITKIIQICNGLEALHSQGITHRDIKPENILVTAEGKVKITDFDLLKLDDASALTMTGAFIGTAKYASPEQCKDAGRIDFRSDLYSLGVIFYELVTGRIPFNGKNFMEIALGHIRSPLISPRQYSPELPSELEKIILRLLEKEPENRFQTAREVARELDKFLNQSEITVNESSTDYLLSPIFVGREKQLHQLENCFTKVTNSEGQSVVVLGESGIGKSRLVEEFKIGLNLHKTINFATKFRIEGGVFEGLQKLILEILDSLRKISPEEQAEILGRLSYDLLKIAPQISEFSVHKHLKELPELSGNGAEFRLFDSFKTFLQNYSEFQKSPLVIIFEDLQWADEISSRFFRYASRNLKSSKIMLLGTCRKEELEKSYFSNTFGELKSQNILQVVELKSLEVESISEMLTSMLGKADNVNTKISEEILRQTNGNPLFVQEVMYHLLSNEKLKKKDGAWDFSEEAFKDLLLPETVQKVISERLQNIDKEIREVLQVGAVLGRSFSSETLAEISPKHKLNLNFYLKEAKNKRLIEETKSKNFSFFHDAVKETLESDLDKENFRSLHKKIGEKLEQSSENIDFHLEELANHFYKAGVLDKASIFCEKAGEKAFRNFAFRKALNFYEKLFDVAQKAQDSKLILKSLRNKAAIFERFGDYKKSKEILQELLILLKYSGEQEKLGETYKNLGVIEWRQNNNEEALELYEKAFELLKDTEDLKLLGGLYGNFGLVHFNLSELDKAMGFYNKQLEMCEILNDKHGFTKVLGKIAEVHRQKSEFEKAIEVSEKSLKICGEINNKIEFAVIKGNLSIIYFQRGDLAKARELSLEQLKIDEELGNKEGIARASSYLGNIFWKEGNFDSAVDFYKKCESIGNEIGMKSALNVALTNLGIIFMEKGDYENSISHYQKALEHSKLIGLKDVQTIAYGNLAEVYRKKGEFEKSLEYCEKAIEISEEIGNKYTLAYWFLEKAQNFYLLENYKKAKDFNDKANNLATSLKVKELEISTQILKAKIDFVLGNQKEAIHELYSLQNEIKDEETLAEIHYEIFVLVQKGQSSGEFFQTEIPLRTHQTKALATFKKIYEQNKKFDLKLKIEELESNSVASFELHSELLTNLVQFMSPESAFSELLRFLTIKCQANTCEIILKNEETGELEVSAVSPNLREEDAEFSYTILSSAIEKNKALCIENAVDVPDFQGHSSIVGRQFLSVIAVPIRSKSKVFGAIYLDRKNLGFGAFEQEDLQTVQKIADILTPILIRQEELRKLRAKSTVDSLGLFIGVSKKMKNVFKQIEKASRVDSTVYIYGESGTGKELVAKSLHELSPRNKKSFIPVNCAAIPKDLAESEFFGHEKGSFSGALNTKIGKFELAEGGTLLLDEIGELPLDLQSKLLRAIQERQIWRVGGQKGIPIDVRIVVATNRNLEEEVKKGTFREDLFYRLNVIKIDLPSLRTRPEDVSILAYHFLEKFNSEIQGFTADGINSLQSYEWKGNVRELENLIEKTVVNHEGTSPITARELFPTRKITQSVRENQLVQTSETPFFVEGQKLDEQLSQLEKIAVERALENNLGNKSNTSTELGITRMRLDRLIEKHSIVFEKKWMKG